jgi:uncharacterized membrane protein YozB (DUF420 family)
MANQLLLRQREQRFFGILAAVAVLLMFCGFARTYYLKPWTDAPALSVLVNVHGIVFTGWIALFALQVTLVGRGRIALHRRVGTAGAVLAALVVALGVTTAIAAAQRGHSPEATVPPLAFLAVPLFNIAGFAVLVGAALALRRDPAAHKRLMLLATITLLMPAISRLPLESVRAGGLPLFIALTDVLVFACFAWDIASRRKVHRATLRGALLIVLTQLASLVVARSAAWLAFARWLTA